MRVTEITKNKGSRYTVYVDGEYFYILDAEIIDMYSLKTGSECTPELLREIKRAADYRKARERALYLLEYRDHSYFELVEKLEKSVDYDIAAKTAAKMAELGFLNDDRYCRRLAKEYMTVKRWGVYRVKAQLRKKGFDRELIDQAVSECLDTVDIYDVIRQLVEKKYLKYLTDQKGIKKTTDALVRQGHSYSDIKEVLAEYTDNDEY